MNKTDAEVIKALLWLIVFTVSTNPYAKAFAIAWVIIDTIAAILAENRSNSWKR